MEGGIFFDLVDGFIENRGDDVEPEMMFHSCPSRSREHVLKTAIRDAIDPLEETRKAYPRNPAKKTDLGSD